MTYEEENWAKLSPRFREAHNRLRAARGQSAIPPPKVDLYVAPPPRSIVPASVIPDAEARALLRVQTGPFDAMMGGAGFALKDAYGGTIFEGDAPPPALLGDEPKARRRAEEAAEALVTDDDRARMRDLKGYRDEGFEIRR